MLIEVDVYPKALPLPGIVMVLLRDKTSGSRMPIFIDPYTAGAVFAALSGKPQERPQTHDLFKSFLIDDCSIIVTKVVVTELRNDAFYAIIHYDKNGESKTKDSRPSDALALAALFSAPAFVEEALWLQKLDDQTTKMHLALFEELEPKLPDQYSYSY